MDIKAMNCSKKEEVLKEAFGYMSRRGEIIFALERKVKELGGDPLFYMTDEQRKERLESEDWIKSLDIFKKD